MNDKVTIEACRVHLVDVPVKTKDKYGPQAPFPFGVSYGVMKGLKRVFLELRARKDDHSLVLGFGEASPFYPYANETPLSVYELLTFYYSNYLKGQSISIQDKYRAKEDLDRIIERAEKYLCRERLNFTQAAIDYALHDLAGRALNIPTYALLTDHPNLSPVRACWSTNSNVTAEESVAEAKRFNEKGYAIKIKLNGDPVDDARRTIGIIQALAGDAASVRADANAGYSPPGYLAYTQEVTQVLSQEETNRVNFYVEEPIDTRDYGRQAFIDLLSASPYRLMADETLYTLDDAKALVEAGKKAGRTDRLLFNIKVQKVGGLKNAMKAAQIAKDNGIPIMIGGMFPSSYGKLANCHYAIAVGQVLDSDGVHPSGDYIDPKDSIIRNLEKLERMENGYRRMDVLEKRPGFGGEVILAALKRNAIRFNFGGYYPDMYEFKIDAKKKSL